MMRLVFLLTLTTFCVNAQHTIDNFLQSAREDVRLRQYNESLQYLGGRPWRLSPIQRLELRSQNRELDPALQEYAVRVTPSNPWELKYTNEYFRSYNSMLSMERALILQESYKDRYEAVAEFIIRGQFHQLAEEIHANINQQVAILEGQIGSGYFDPDDYLDAQLDLIEANAELHETEIERSGASTRIKFLSAGKMNDNLAWTVSDLISVSRIQRVIDSLRHQSLMALAISYQKERIRLTQVQYKLEKSNVNTGFVQAEFDQRRVEQQRTPVNISLGITIPIFNPNKGDMARRKLDEFEAVGEMTAETNENQFVLDVLADQIAKNSHTYLKVAEQIEKINKSQLGKSLSELKDNDPRVMVRFYGSTLKLKEVQLKLYELILLDYVEFVALSGAITESPQVNFLSEDLHLID